MIEANTKHNLPSLQCTKLLDSGKKYEWTIENMAQCVYLILIDIAEYVSVLFWNKIPK